MKNRYKFKPIPLGIDEKELRPVVLTADQEGMLDAYLSYVQAKDALDILDWRYCKAPMDEKPKHARNMVSGARQLLEALEKLASLG
jgi:hypothetical protein